jgi:hypothetical protein
MIRFTYSHLKPVALFLSIMVLFQCCVVYDKQPVTINDAIDKDQKIKRIKIEMSHGKSLKLSTVFYKGNQLYGILFKSEIDEPIEVKISEDDIVKIVLQNRKNSKILTAVFVITIATIFVLSTALFNSLSIPI